MQFKVGLGYRQTQTFRFMNFAKVKTEYQCKVDSPDFIVDKSIIAPPATSGGNEITVDITYEPSKLGDIRATLIVHSEQGGEYTVSLFGHCTNPLPQGPVLIKGVAPVPVSIFNPFTKPATFLLGVDSPAYSVKPTELTIGAKKTAVATVAYKNASNATAVTSGKLTVTTEETNAPWIYYLKGSN